MPQFNHMYSLAFEVISDHEDGEDVTPQMLKEALLRRIKNLDESPESGEWLEATGCPEDTYEIEN